MVPPHASRCAPVLGRPREHPRAAIQSLHGAAPPGPPASPRFYCRAALGFDASLVTVHSVTAVASGSTPSTWGLGPLEWILNSVAPSCTPRAHVQYSAATRLHPDPVGRCSDLPRSERVDYGSQEHEGFTPWKIAFPSAGLCRECATPQPRRARRLLFPPPLEPVRQTQTARRDPPASKCARASPARARAAPAGRRSQRAIPDAAAAGGCARRAANREADFEHPLWGPWCFDRRSRAAADLPIDVIPYSSRWISAGGPELSAAVFGAGARSRDGARLDRAAARHAAGTAAAWALAGRWRARRRRLAGGLRVAASAYWRAAREPWLYLARPGCCRCAVGRIPGARTAALPMRRGGSVLALSFTSPHISCTACWSRAGAVPPRRGERGSWRRRRGAWAQDSVCSC